MVVWTIILSKAKTFRGARFLFSPKLADGVFLLFPTGRGFKDMSISINSYQSCFALRVF
jgi:hypothetical protein